jgi:hypothetical protein
LAREEFKDTALNILYKQTEYFLGKNIKLFTSDDIERYKVAQYDEDEWNVEASMPLDDFLDELYEVMKNE